MLHRNTQYCVGKIFERLQKTGHDWNYWISRQTTKSAIQEPESSYIHRHLCCPNFVSTLTKLMTRLRNAKFGCLTFLLPFCFHDAAYQAGTVADGVLCFTSTFQVPWEYIELAEIISYTESWLPRSPSDVVFMPWPSEQEACGKIEHSPVNQIHQLHHRGPSGL